MVLHDVANRSDFFIKAPAALHTEALGHRDLHTRDIVAVPDGFEKGVGEPEIQKILYGFLSEQMIDSANGRLRKELMQHAVQRLRRSEIPAQRFCDDDLGVIR